MTFIAYILAATVFLAGCANGCGGGGSQTPSPAPQAATTAPVIVTNSDAAALTINAEIADSPEERATGLSNRSYLARDAGMIFVFDSPASVSFWMKDTHITLDMIFINSSGTILAINKNAVPESLTPYTSPPDVKYVLEVNGGWCDDNNVATGNSVDIPDGI